MLLREKYIASANLMVLFGRFRQLILVVVLTRSILLLLNIEYMYASTCKCNIRLLRLILKIYTVYYHYKWPNLKNSSLLLPYAKGRKRKFQNYALCS